MSRHEDDVLASLDALLESLERFENQLPTIRQRARSIRRDREHGRSYAELARGEESPLIVEILSEVLGQVQRDGARFRRAEARALYAEGLTMERIAELFGVTRQRVSALLRVERH